MIVLFFELKGQLGSEIREIAAIYKKLDHVLKDYIEKK
tara:strand:+ start:1621 stop:1734 length:114 start_codon:yes stop_codon:yes gene_type:complete